MFDLETIRTNAAELLDIWQEASEGRITPPAAVCMLQEFVVEDFKFDLADEEAYRAAFPRLNPSQLRSEAAVRQALVESIWSVVVPTFAADRYASISEYRTQLDRVARSFGKRFEERIFASDNYDRQPITLGDFVDFLRGDGRSLRKEVDTLIGIVSALPDDADFDDFERLASRLKFVSATMPDASSISDGINEGMLALIESDKNQLLGLARFAEFARDGIVQFNTATTQKKSQAVAYRV